MADFKRKLSTLFLLGYLNAAFLATKSGYTTDVTDPIVFDLTPVNYGGYFDSTTGIYTVAMDGLYEFNVQIYCSLKEEICVYYITVDGTRMTDTPSGKAGTVSATGNIGLATSVILELSKGQQVSISPGDFEYEMDGMNAGMASWFAGQFLVAY